MNIAKMSIGCAGAILAGLFLSGCVGMSTRAARNDSEADFLIKDGDKVVFYGDSITDGQWYPTFIRAFVATRQPGWRNTFLHRGVSGDRTSSLERFDRDAVAQKPDALLFMMGYNDMRYGKLTSKWLSTFLGNVEESVRMLRSKSPKTRLLLISSPLNETVVSHEPCWASPKSYPYTLLMLSREEKMLAEKLKVPFLDMGTQYGALVGLGEIVGQEVFALSRDGVHPQQAGQLFLAAFMLEKMGAEDLVALSELDAVNATVEKNVKCTVKKVNWTCEGDFVFERCCSALPFPVPPTSGVFAFLADINEKLNRDILRVKRLDDKAYELKIDGVKVTDLRADELADGVNLSNFMTPMRRQALKVLAAARALDELKSEIFLLIRKGELDGFGGVTAKTPKELKAKLPAMMKSIESAKLALYSMNKPISHRFMLTPIKNVPEPFSALVENPLNQSHLKIEATPLKVNANNGTLEKGTFSLTISNPNTTAKTGAVEWRHCPNWRIEPESAKFAVPAGGETVLKFKSACSGKVDVSTAPKAEIRWIWSKNWHYPRIETLKLPLAPSLSIPKRSTRAKIDGGLDDWRKKPMIELNRVAQVDPAVPGKRKLWNGPDDLSAGVWLDWDEKALYVAVAVKDSCHLQRKQGKKIWSDDCVFLSFQMDSKSSSKGRYEFALALGEKGSMLVKYMDGAKTADGPDVNLATRKSRNGSGVVYEAAIPWRRLAPFKPSIGASFRFTVTVNDADDTPGKGFNYIEWTPGVNYGKNPRKFGTIVLAK
jgi:lysophospholipase L1-like esterase